MKKTQKHQKEIVFLPYKASMWDSLESIWKAAQEDEDCDVYVVPIPYYDKNPDGSFREMHYEADQYPDDVPIVGYEEYDFEARQPDMIFIHNPYDQHNRVTSVHPFFYSKNLKQFTKKLIYVPYFVLRGINPADDAVTEGIMQYSMTLGVIHADRVIVQSEDMRQAYVKALLNGTNNHGEDMRRYWEGKILGLGSPKWDRVASMLREEIRLPDEWMKIIQKPDGSWKKVVFYNTSVVALLHHGEKMFAKIRGVLSFFHKNKEEAALLWRPHPLMEATVLSMRPQLWAEYDGIVRNYIKEGWGIYDDTAELDRAIVVSDAYYGDESSVVQLYQQTGKPAIIQDLTLSGNMDRTDAIAIWPSVFHVDGRTVWFVHGKINILMKYDMDSRTVDIIGRIPNEKMMVGRPYTVMERYGDVLFFIPSHNKNICFYDMHLDQFGIIELRDTADTIVFCGGHRFGKYVYCIPCYYDKIVRLDMENKSVQYLLNWKEECITDGMYINDSVKVGESRIAGVWSGGKDFFVYDINENVMQFDVLPVDNAKITTLTEKDGLLFINDYANKRILKYSLKERRISGEIVIPFSAGVLSRLPGGKIMADSFGSEELLIIDQNDEITVRKKEKTDKNPEIFYEYQHGLYKEEGGVQYYFDRGLSKLVVVKNGETEEYPFSITLQQSQEIMAVLVNDELRRLMADLKASPTYKAECTVPHQIGKLIWERLKYEDYEEKQKRHEESDAEYNQ